MDLFLGDRRNIHIENLRDCENTKEITLPDVQSFRYNFVTKGSTAYGSALAVNLSKAIDLAFSDLHIDRLEMKHFRKFQQCAEEVTGNSELRPVDFQEMSGMFLIVGVIAGLGVAISIVSFFMRRRRGDDADAPPIPAAAPKPDAGGEAAAKSLALLLARHRDEYCDIYNSLSHLRHPSQHQAPDAAVRTECSSTSASIDEAAQGGYKSPPADGCVAVQHRARRRRSKSKCTASAESRLNGEAAPLPAVITGRDVRLSDDDDYITM